MVTFGDITIKNLRVNYTKEDKVGYKVVGTASYNKDNQLTDASGDIRDSQTNEHIANFNIHAIMREERRISLTNCIEGRMNEAVAVAEATLADLALGYNV